MLCLPLDSAGHERVQPAAEHRHLQRHYHVPDVSGALGACPCHPPTSRAHAARHLGHRPNALPPPGSLPPPHLCPPFGRAAGRVCVQPAAELRHLQRHYHGLHVSGALRACPCHPLTSRAHAARHLSRRPNALPPPGSLPPPHLCPPFGRAAGHVCVQPAAEPRHVQRHEHAVHVSGALRACPCHPLPSRAHAARHLGRRPNGLPSPGPPYRAHAMPTFALGRTPRGLIRPRSTSR